MHVEFATVVVSALQEALAQDCWRAVPYLSPGPQLIRAEMPVTVLPVPQGVQAEICSPVLFQLAQRVQAALERRPAGSGGAAAEKLEKENAAPAELGRPLLEILDRRCSYFSFHLGGTGHLNAGASDEFGRRFCTALLRRGSEALFSPEPLLAAPLPAADPVPENLQTQSSLQFFSEYVFRSKEQPAAALSGKADWSRIAAEIRISKQLLIERAVKSNNPDAAELLAAYDHTAPWSIDQAVMLLAVIGDPEIDSKAYRCGLSGRENVPWYFDRFFRDAGRYLKALESGCNGRRCAGERAEEFEPCGLENIWSRLFRFRETLFRSVLARQAGRKTDYQPERLVLAAIDLIQGYYLFYNRPEWRIDFERLTAERTRAAAELTRLLRDTISGVVALLKNACGNADFTIDKYTR